MEPTKVRTRILSQIQHMVSCAIIRDRRFLDDEQLIRVEQLAVLEEIFNANVRDLNSRIEMFPSSVVANLGNFKMWVYFEVADLGVRAVPEVDL